VKRGHNTIRKLAFEAWIEKEREMISRVPVFLIALTLLWCDPMIPRSHAQQAKTLTSAVQVIGKIGRAHV